MNQQEESKLGVQAQQPITSEWNIITPENPLIIATKYNVNTIGLSPDGKYIASAGYGGYNIIQIWDLRTGKQVGQSLQGHKDGILCLNYSKCGHFIISCSYDKTIRQWSTITYEECQPLIRLQKNVSQVQYSFDQKHIISCQDSLVYVWIVRTGQEQVSKRIQHSMRIYRMNLSSSQSLVVFGDLKGKLRIWDYNKHKQCRKLIGHTNEITTLTYSVNSKLIVSSSLDLTIRIWNSTTSMQIANLCGHRSNYIYQVNFSPNMKFIISALNNSRVRIWKRLTENQIDDCQLDHKKPINTAQFSLDGKYIITGSGGEWSIKIMVTPTSCE